MYIIKQKFVYLGESKEILAETQVEVEKIISYFNKNNKILESVNQVPDYEYASEYLNKVKEKPDDLVYGNKKGETK